MRGEWYRERVATKLAALAELSRFESLDRASRLALGAALAESLGREFRPRPTLVGIKEMVAVEHVPSAIELVAIPGGTFEMGFTSRDDDEVRRCVDYESAEIQRWLRTIVTMCSPSHAVVVSPFLLSRAHLSSMQVAAVGGPRTDELSIDAAAAFVKSATDFRLPSEAELEFAAREGGSVSFVHDCGRVWSTTRAWPNESAWGIRALNDAAWTADEWHDDYENAPTTSAPWTSGGPPGVYRGCLMEPPRSDDELLFALAASRGARRRNAPGDEWPVLVRVARSIDV
jgi:formylglycine-generating enzyme required for sulfatase activity